MIPMPGDTSHVGVSPVTSRPARSRTTARNRITAPVRAVDVAGVTSMELTFDESTSTGTACVALPARAVSVARPGAIALTTPAALTCATPLADVLHVNRSSRRSPAAEYAEP